MTDDYHLANTPITLFPLHTTARAWWLTPMWRRHGDCVSLRLEPLAKVSCAGRGGLLIRTFTSDKNRNWFFEHVVPKLTS